MILNIIVSTGGPKAQFSGVQMPFWPTNSFHAGYWLIVHDIAIKKPKRTRTGALPLIPINMYVKSVLLITV
jgi:hypothetical protein